MQHNVSGYQTVVELVGKATWSWTVKWDGVVIAASNHTYRTVERAFDDISSLAGEDVVVVH